MPLFLSIMSWLAKMESDRRSERIQAAMTAAKANGGITRKGKRLGRPLGKKDGPEVKRKRSSYMARWERARDLHNKTATPLLPNKEGVNNLPSGLEATRGDKKTEELNLAGAVPAGINIG